MEIADLLIDLARELRETLPHGVRYKVGDSWCYILDDILYTSLGMREYLIGITEDKIGIALMADGDPNNVIKMEIRMPLMEIFNKLNVLVVPA